MNLSSEQKHRRRAARHHGVTLTLNATRRSDVPVVKTLVEGHLVVPVDLAKPKASTWLQRRRTVESDPSAHYPRAPESPVSSCSASMP